MLAKAPDEFGLIPDEDGFVKIKELLQTLHEEDGWRHVRQATLNELTMTLPDVSFEIVDNRIRSLQRISLIPDVAATVPILLYTSIRQRAYVHVLQKGVSPSSHNQVVLSADKELAEKIGKRKTADPVTLTVNTEQAEQQGVVFYQSGDKLFLADYIPEGCFRGPALPKEKKQAKKPATEPPPTPVEGIQNLAGSFFPDPLSKNDKTRARKRNKKKDPAWKRERRKAGKR